MKRKLYFWFLVFLKPSRWFRLSWRARLAEGRSGIRRLCWHCVENLVTKEKKYSWVPDPEYVDVYLSVLMNLEKIPFKLSNTSLLASTLPLPKAKWRKYGGDEKSQS